VDGESRAPGGGARHFTVGNAFKIYDWEEATTLGDRATSQHYLTIDNTRRDS
jgi:hypothetical protein